MRERTGSGRWRVDYDESQHGVYQQGRKLDPRVIDQWVAAVRSHSPPHVRWVADVGCGSGRFAPALADGLGARVVGVEPSVRMLEIARTRSHGDVRHVTGRAERIPLRSGTVDVVFLSMVAHHLQDLPVAAGELARVAGPDGVVIFRNVFRGRMGDIPLFRYFPRARQIENERAPSVDEVAAAFDRHGFDVAALEPIRQKTDANLTAHYERLRQRALSVFEFLTEDEIRAGLAQLEHDARRADPGEPVQETIDLLVLRRARRPGSSSTASA